jgi:hypothetical protein
LEQSSFGFGHTDLVEAVRWVLSGS